MTLSVSRSAGCRANFVRQSWRQVVAARVWMALSFSLFVLLSASLTACAPLPLVSAYDEPTDKALTAIQQSTDDFITELIATAPSPQNAFDPQQAFYVGADQQLRRLEFRVASIPNNSQTVKLVADIRTSLLGTGACSADGSSLRDLHCSSAEARARGPSKVALQIAQRNLNQTIGAALALELAKKQGLKP